MTELGDLQTQLAALKKARGSGALIVRHGDTSVQYRSISELDDAIASINGEINSLNGVGRKPRYGIQTTKGL